MNTQNTPVHIKLWHRDFWLMAIANLLVTMSVYILIPVLPLWMAETEHFSAMETGLSMGVFGIGIFALGGMCSYLVQRYRRNVVCMCAIMAMIACIGMLYYIESLKLESIEFSIILLQRFALGASFGLAQMVLSSTLIIDTSESFQRTEANHCASWFARFSLSLGPLIGIILYKYVGFNCSIIVSLACAAASLVLIKSIAFPFRTPDETVKFISLDRFFLPQGILLFVNLVLITTVVGLLLSLQHSPQFWAMIMVGFFLALLSQKFAFQNAELKSEVITGLILIGAAILVMLTGTPMAVYVTPLFVGWGIGLIGSRFLLFFIKLSRHCQRGTSQSTFMLGWEFGLALGLFLGYAVFTATNALLFFALGITVISFLLYNFFTHKWFVTHKNR